MQHNRRRHIKRGERIALGTIIDNVKDAIAASSNIIESAEHDVAWLAYGPVLIFTTQFHLNEQAKALIGKGGRVRGITEILPSNIEVISKLIRIGEDVRHLKPFGGTSFMLIGDNKQSISSLRINVEDLAADDQIVAFWSKEPSYAEHLLSGFESAWTKGVDARERIRELLKEGAGQNAIVKSKVQPDGTQSTDPNSDPITYAWTLLEKPSGSKAQLADGTTAQPTLMPDKLGTYIIQLVVTRGGLQSTDTVTVTAVNKPPK